MKNDLIITQVASLLNSMFKIAKQIIKHEIDNTLSILLILEECKTISLNDLSEFLNTKDIYYLIISVSEVQLNTEKYQKIVLKYFNTLLEKQQYEKEEENKRLYDHRHMFETMGLGLFLPEHPGFVTLLSRGLEVFQNIKNIIKKLSYNDCAYNEVRTAPMMDVDLWKKTGHYQNYANNMFIFDDEGMALKPMSCPAHALVFKHHRITSLPYRIAEFGECFRNESKGGLLGLKRTRFFTQDDGHIFCLLEQVQDEIAKFLTQVVKIYHLFGFHNIKFVFATRPEKFHGNIDEWDKIEQSVISYLKSTSYNFEIAPGEGAFYGPKIEFHIQDLNHRYWQCGTIQIDWQLSTLLDAYCIIQGEKVYPIVLHRAILGSIERFVSMLLENHHGLPIICNDLKVVAIILNESILSSDYISKLKNELPITMDIDFHTHTKERIKKWSLLKPNYIIFVGDKEIHENKICARINNTPTLFNFDEFVTNVQKELLI